MKQTVFNRESRELSNEPWNSSFDPRTKVDNVKEEGNDDGNDDWKELQVWLVTKIPKKWKIAR